MLGLGGMAMLSVLHKKDSFYMNIWLNFHYFPSIICTPPPSPRPSYFFLVAPLPDLIQEAAHPACSWLL